MTPMNVGSAGGDLVTRRFAMMVTLSLTALAVPGLEISDSTLRIAALLVAMSGALFLMAGMVFLQKTHFAGIMLMPSACGIMAVSHLGSRWGAVAIGLVFSGLMISSLVTRRCGLNRLLGIDSCP